MNTSSRLLKEIDNEKIINPDLVFYAFDRLETFEGHYKSLRETFPNAQLVGFSTAGHFFSDNIQDREGIYSLIQFEHSSVECRSFNLSDFNSSEQLGLALGKEMQSIKYLKGVTIISDGQNIDGTDLMKGINKNLDSSIPLFGGMAGDQRRFEETYVGLNEVARTGVVVAVGFVGEELKVNSTCQDGWTEMGMEFTITKSKGNTIYELDNENVYDTLYKLLESTSEKEFTMNTLHYPFKLHTAEKNDIIRTMRSIDHKNKTITFGGHMPQGRSVSLMKGSAMDMLDCASAASERANFETDSNSFIMAISCLGRRVVLSDLAKEEYAEVKRIFGEKSNVFGFYSYGEYARLNNENNHCLLHNQTFTVASITE